MRVDDVEADLSKLASEVARKYRRVRSVIAYSGVKGPYRLPASRHVWGEPPQDLIHREYGVEFMVDPLRVMFCLGNSFERLRTAMLTRDWETVVDLFAGVGQFSVPIAVHARPKKVYAIEINEEAYSYLVRNVNINRVSDVVQPLLGDCRGVVERGLRRVADRVIMGYFFGTIDYLPAGLSCLRREGGVIHFHEVIRKGSLNELESELIRECGSLGYRSEVINSRIVKSYSSSREHAVVDLLALPEVPD